MGITTVASCNLSPDSAGIDAVDYEDLISPRLKEQWRHTIRTNTTSTWRQTQHQLLLKICDEIRVSLRNEQSFLQAELAHAKAINFNCDSLGLATDEYRALNVHEEANFERAAQLRNQMEGLRLAIKSQIKSFGEFNARVDELIDQAYKIKLNELDESTVLLDLSIRMAYAGLTVTPENLPKRACEIHGGTSSYEFPLPDHKLLLSDAVRIPVEPTL